jgi:hypothetical protein
MESGAALLVWTLLSRMHARLGGDLNQLVDHVVNNAAAWTFPEIANEEPEDRERALADWERHVATLDTAILSLIGENDIPDEGIPDEGIEVALDDILQSSLWQRRLLRQNEQVQQALKTGLVSCSRLIWTQSTAARRRGYFLAGVGLTTGHTSPFSAVQHRADRAPYNCHLVPFRRKANENLPDASFAEQTELRSRPRRGRKREQLGRLGQGFSERLAGNPSSVPATLTMIENVPTFKGTRIVAPVPQGLASG